MQPSNREISEHYRAETCPGFHDLLFEPLRAAKADKSRRLKNVYLACLQRESKTDPDAGLLPRIVFTVGSHVYAFMIGTDRNSNPLQVSFSACKVARIQAEIHSVRIVGQTRLKKKDTLLAGHAVIKMFRDSVHGIFWNSRMFANCFTAVVCESSAGRRLILSKDRKLSPLFFGQLNLGFEETDPGGTPHLVGSSKYIRETLVANSRNDDSFVNRKCRLM